MSQDMAGAEMRRSDIALVLPFDGLGLAYGFGKMEEGSRSGDGYIYSLLHSNGWILQCFGLGSCGIM